MNNVIRLNTHTDYPALNAPALREALRSAADAAIEINRLFEQTQYLPHFYNRLSFVDKAMRRADFTMRDQIQQLTLKLSSHAAQLKELEEELNTASASDEEEILEDIASHISATLRLINSARAELNVLYQPTTEAVERRATDNYMVQLTREQERLPAEILELEARKEALAEKRQAVTAAMAIIESKGFAEIAKETVITAQEIAALAVAPPQIALIEKGLQVAQQVLEKLERAITYFGMVEARNSIRTQMEALTDKAHGKEIELRHIGMRKELIQNSHRFDDQRQLYAAEFASIVSAVQLLPSIYAPLDTTEKETVAEFINDVQALALHLKPLI